MKPRPPSPRDFLPSAAALSRATFAATVAGLAAGILLLIAGFVAAQPQWSIAGAGSLALAWAGWVWSQRQAEDELSERILEQFVQNSPPLDDQRAAQLLALLTEWEAIEEKRGSPDFDPWALQSLRNDIRRMVESDPALEQLFSDLRRAA